MANLGKKGSIYVARFRFEGKEYKKSLKTSQLADARAAMLSVERAIYGLTTGMIDLPHGVDAGDFILSGGTLKEASRARRRALSMTTLIDEYLTGQSHKAPSSVYTEGVHLRNLKTFLGAKVESSADKIEPRNLEQFLQSRLKIRSASTVHKERDTISQLFRWAVTQGYLEQSPAKDLSTVKPMVELPHSGLLVRLRAPSHEVD